MAEPHLYDEAVLRITNGFVEVNSVYRHPVTGDEGTPLTFAVRRNHQDHVRDLLVRGADPNLRFVASLTGKTDAPLLFYAASLEVLELLLDAGSDVRAEHQEPLLHHFVRRSRINGHPIHIAMAQAALRAGADPAQRDSAGMDAAAFAESHGKRVFNAYAPLLGKELNNAATKSAKKPEKGRTAKRRRVTKS